MKIVLTGGPSAGKTSLIEILARNYWDRLCVVPEAASILFHGGFPRGTDEFQLRCGQRAIYYTQQELEKLGNYEAAGRSLICDRGSMDGVAYWPGDEASFLRDMNSTLTLELARYDWVIHLETAPNAGYKSSKVRIESQPQARILDQKVKEAWRQHPRRLIIHNSTDFMTKANKALRCVQMILDGSSHTEISAFLE